MKHEGTGDIYLSQQEIKSLKPLRKFQLQITSDLITQKKISPASDIYFYFKDASLFLVNLLVNT